MSGREAAACPHGMPNARTCIQCMEEGPVEKLGGKLVAADWTEARFEGRCANNNTHKITPGDYIGMVKDVGWCCSDCAE